MTNDITYTLADDGLAFYAYDHTRRIGEITFVRVGIDKIMIDHTHVDAAYDPHDIDAELVAHVVNLARQSHRHILCLCPRARAIFNRTPAYDDVRLMNDH
ncbi:GNAT family N-acetyltransferase [bacterium]|nr:GNAT family N-acetyltransferase [bacterium]